ncbi:MAG: glycerophosphodiester phosphodiesterase [bacterium]
MPSRWLTADRLLVIAHRGASASAPENTLAAFRLAAEQGADAIELDVRRTHDDRLVVIHDERVDRTSDGRGLVAEMMAEAARRVDAGGWFAPSFAGERIPLLTEVLEAARGRLLVDIELKESDLDELVIAAVREAGMDDAVLLTSFQPQALRAPAAQNLPVGLLFDQGNVDQALEIDATVALPRLDLLSGDLVARCRSRGVRVIPWTARTEVQVRRAVDLGADGVIADDPLLVRRIIG